MTPPLPLNPAQREAVEHPGGPLLVLAGAGSGKTRVLTARIAHLITALHVAPQRIFAVTFTNKAAGEMRTRIGQLLGADPRGLWIGTFHSLSARLLRREAPLLGFGSNFTIYDSDDSEALVKRLLEARQLSTKVYPPRSVHGVISSAKNRMLTPEELGAQLDTPLIKVAADVYAALGPALKQANAMDFDDLLLHPLTLFREHPERLAYWQDRFQHVLVDEFQDTNAAQYLLVKHLARQHGNLCVVGDDDQAIYGWRGADVRHMLTFQNDFPGTKLVRLEQNYRSTQIILDAANGIIAENTARLGKTLFTEKKGGAPVTLLSSADERDEAEWLANEFARRAADGEAEYEGMAVLYRTNAQSRPLEEAFRFRGIPYRLIGAISFYERREVKDLLAYLRLIANPADDEAFLRVVNVPRRGIGDASLAVLGRAAAAWQKPLLEATRRAGSVSDLRPNVREALSGVAALLDRLREAVGQADPATALETILATTGYEQYLAEEGAEGMERIENVRELVAGRSRTPRRPRAPALRSSATSRRPPSSRPWTRIRTSPASRCSPRTWRRDSSGRSSRSRVWRMDSSRSVARPSSRAASKKSDDCVTWVSRARAKSCISHGRARGIATAGWSLRSRHAFSTRCRRKSSRSAARHLRGSRCAGRERCRHGRHGLVAPRRGGCRRTSDFPKTCRRTRHATSKVSACATASSAAGSCARCRVKAATCA